MKETKLSVVKEKRRFEYGFVLIITVIYIYSHFGDKPILGIILLSSCMSRWRRDEKFLRKCTIWWIMKAIKESENMWCTRL